MNWPSPVTPVAVEWHQIMFKHPEYAYEISINGNKYDLSNSELNIVEVPDNTPLRFSLDVSDTSVVFELELGQKMIQDTLEPYHSIKRISEITGTI